MTTENKSIGVTEMQKNKRGLRLLALRQIEQEMVRDFNAWDEAIKDKRQPVTIQDLEYWQMTIRTFLKEEAEN